jgi:hypothetical protein
MAEEAWQWGAAQSFAPGFMRAVPDYPHGPRPIDRRRWIVPLDLEYGYRRNPYAQDRLDVKVGLAIDRNGHVTDCWPKATAPGPLADRVCDLLGRRARFQPARDIEGRAVPAMSFQHVRWTPPPMPFEVGDRMLVVDVTADNRVVACRRYEDGHELVVDRIGRCVDPRGIARVRKLTGQIGPLRLAMRFVRTVGPSASALPPLRPQAIAISDSRIRAVLGRDGLLRDCRSVGTGLEEKASPSGRLKTMCDVRGRWRIVGAKPASAATALHLAQRVSVRVPGAVGSGSHD